MATFTFEQQRVIIQFLHLRGIKPIEIHQQLSETCNDGVTDVKNVRSWVRQFTEGRTACENKPKEPYNDGKRAGISNTTPQRSVRTVRLVDKAV